ncbi:MotA/TolQ/ExbB proton channel family protein [Reinekea marinisedimentorum]|uniref:Biopolymer transport protein ExbB n=1 Tax=Reinekea marinisedimentorum TaxID=230495 RepID=A0A4R3HTC3_9GAMM|nr:MotA/TolQ/ExbB proton channel family protein [Reinekea marinisedimentorum]TCS36407.1 biopolymer transport protein ExbB [Reinekea marinisedimentorum]
MQTLIEYGPIVWILLSMSVLALTIFFIKVWQLLYSGANRTADVETCLQHWQKGDVAKAIAALKTSRPVSHVVQVAVQGVEQKNLPEDRLTQELNRIAQLKMLSLRSLLRPLEVIATLAPLLGLLGTVLGMITAFQQMEIAGANVDPSVLSGGIWQALLTTAMGLSVAIPVVAMHTWLERRVDSVASKMDDAVTRVFTQLPEALKSNVTALGANQRVA